MNNPKNTLKTKSLLDFKSYLPEEYRTITFVFGKSTKVPVQQMIQDDDSLVPFILMQINRLRPRKLKQLGLEAEIMADNDTLMGMRLTHLALEDQTAKSVAKINHLIKQAGQDLFKDLIVAGDCRVRDQHFSEFLHFCKQFIESKYTVGEPITDTELLTFVFAGHPNRNIYSKATTGILVALTDSNRNSDDIFQIDDLFENSEDSETGSSNEPVPSEDDDPFDFTHFFEASDDDLDKEKSITSELSNQLDNTPTISDAIKTQQHETLTLVAIAKSRDPVVSQFIEKLKLIGKLPRPKNEPIIVTETLFWAAVLSAPKMRREVAKLLNSGGDLLVTKPVMNLLREVAQSVDDRLYNSGDDDGQNWFNCKQAEISMMKLQDSMAALIGYIFKQGDDDIVLDLIRFEHCVKLASTHDGLPETRAIFEKYDFSRLTLSQMCAQIRTELEAHIVGQDEAKEALINAFRASQNGTAHERRGPVFLYGTSGVGKTALIKTFAQALNSACEDNYEFQMFNMEQLSDERDMLQLFGAGHIYACSSMGKLTTETEFLPNRIILFDEIEKAHEIVRQSLLSLLSAGECEDRSTRRLIDFSQCIFVFTSNVGQEDAQSGKPSNHQSVLTSKFSPEFVNRVMQGHVCCCRPLTDMQKLQFLDSITHQLREQVNIKFDNCLPNALAMMAGDLSPRSLQGQSTKLIALINEAEDQPILDAELLSHRTHVTFLLPDSCQDLSKLIANMGQRKWHSQINVQTSLMDDIIQIEIELNEPQPQYEAEHLNYPFLKIITHSESTFAQIIGQSKAVTQLQQQTDLLAKKAASEKSQTAIDGTLLYGRPGTGKTQLAGAIANRFTGTFIQVNSTDLTMGDTQANIKKLFEIAHQYAPSIVFLDEVDAIAPRRENLSVAGNLMVTALLTAMDGFEKSKSPVWVIGATNNPDNIDPAVLREGRFGQKVAIDFPTHKEINGFVDSYLTQLHVEQIMPHKLTQLSHFFHGKSMGFIKEILAISYRKDVTFEQFYRACIANSLEKSHGEIKSSEDMDEEATSNVAYHEAGHAVAIGMLNNGGFKQIILAEITPRAQSQGLVQRTIKPCQKIATKRQIKNELQAALAGRAAELILAKDEEDLSIGASSDITTATMLAQEAITRQGFSNRQSLFDHRFFTPSEKDVCEEVKEWTQQAHESVMTLLTQNWPLVTAIANALKQKQTLFTDDIQQIVAETAYAAENNQKCASSVS